MVDVVFVVVILVPGFVALMILRWLTYSERKVSDYELVVGSLFFSLFIFTLFSYMNGITNIDDITQNMFSLKYIVEIMGMGLAIGVVPGLIIRLYYRRKKYVEGPTWQASLKMAGKDGCWIIVHTTDGSEYKGILHYYGGKNMPNEISIRKPKLILRDEDSFVKNEFPFGEEILFTEKDIKRIVFFKEV